MNIEDLAIYVHGQGKTRSITQARDVIHIIFDMIETQVTAGHNVTIYNFGTFYAQECSERRGRNQLTGEEITIPPRRRFRLRPSRNVTERMNKDKK